MRRDCDLPPPAADKCFIIGLGLGKPGLTVTAPDLDAAVACAEALRQALTDGDDGLMAWAVPYTPDNARAFLTDRALDLLVAERPAA